MKKVGLTTLLWEASPAQVLVEVFWQATTAEKTCLEPSSLGRYESRGLLQHPRLLSGDREAVARLGRGPRPSRVDRRRCLRGDRGTECPGHDHGLRNVGPVGRAALHCAAAGPLGAEPRRALWLAAKPGRCAQAADQGNHYPSA